ncbi:hypothetical protein BGZ72_007687 [Mortierella alpina]|nr:hypothetical protein BGZ72_007687 [Mortierella alpina]
METPSTSAAGQGSAPSPAATPAPTPPANTTTTTGSSVPNTPAHADQVPMEEVVSTNAVEAEVIARQNQTIVEEYQYLLEKSQQLFTGLRFALETTYGLKRWEVGEIASKIGQLYYHYYLRTSETNYLQESYVFYDAIRERRYFNEISEMKNPALMIKKLRFYARFTVVCLLLNNRDIITTLKEELAALVNEYINTYTPTDAAEWQLVLQEVTSFTDAEKRLHPVNTAGTFLPVARRLQSSKVISAALDKDGSSTTKFRLQEAILVGSVINQIKFSELTIDMYRILQSLERETSQIRGSSEPPAKDTVTSAVAAAVAGGTAAENNSPSAPIKEEPAEESSISQRRNATEKGSKRTNPHKYLLYRPTLSQLMVYLATAFKEVSSDSALLIYISADGLKRTAPDNSGTKGYHGGILTNSRKAQDNVESEQQSISHCLHPGDLLPFTRKPMFLIVDSNNSVAFAAVPT